MTSFLIAIFLLFAVEYNLAQAEGITEIDPYYVFAFVGCSVKLTCTLNSTSAATVEWFREENLIDALTENGRFLQHFLNSERQAVSILTIGNISEKDNGTTYTCKIGLQPSTTNAFIHVVTDVCNEDYSKFKCIDGRPTNNLKDINCTTKLDGIKTLFYTSVYDTCQNKFFQTICSCKGTSCPNTNNKNKTECQPCSNTIFNDFEPVSTISTPEDTIKTSQITDDMVDKNDGQERWPISFHYLLFGPLGGIFILVILIGICIVIKKEDTIEEPSIEYDPTSTGRIKRHVELPDFYVKQ